MKIISSTLLLVLLSSSYSLHAMHDNEKVRSKNIIIKKNFKFQENRLFCITPLEEYNVVEAEFKKLINHFPYDRDLKYHYARFLVDSPPSIGQFGEGLKQFAEFIQFFTPTSPQTWVFMEYISQIGVGKQPLKNFLDHIIPPIQDWNEYAKNLKIKNMSSQLRNNNPTIVKTVRDRVILENSKLLFNSLKNISDNIIYDTVLKVITEELDNNNLHKTKSDLLHELYTNDTEPSLFLRESYVRYYLIGKKKYDIAISLLEGVLDENAENNRLKPLLLDLVTDEEDPEYNGRKKLLDIMDRENPNNTIANYNDLAFLYVAAAQGSHTLKEAAALPEARAMLEKAVALSENALSIDDLSPLTLHRLAFIQTVLGNYDEALKKFDTLKAISVEKFAKHNIRTDMVEKNYQLFLKLSGREEELQEILYRKQEKILKENKKIAELIKAAQAAHLQAQKSREEENTARLLQERQQKVDFKNDQQKSKASAPSHVIADRDQEKMFSYEEKETISVPKPKKKTRGTPHSRSAAGEITEKSKENNSLIYIESITGNKNAWKTFYLLFSKYYPDVRSDSNVKISLNKISTFFEALNQDYDSTHGKGSHKKITLNTQQFGSEMDEKMLILTNKNYLKPEQIKALREAFIFARIVPDDPDIIQKLKEDGYLED